MRWGRFKCTRTSSSDLVAEPLSARLRDPGGHEQRISARFPGQCVWAGEEQAFNQDLLVLGFTNRSGSNLLGDYLRQTKLVQSLGENLNWSSVINHANQNKINSFPDYIRFLVDIGPARSHFGIKATWDQLSMLYRWNIPAMFCACRVIIIQRRSILRQAVSLSIANQTQKWSSRQVGIAVAPVYNSKSIIKIMNSIERSNAMMLRLCEALSINYTTLYYDDLIREPNSSVQQALCKINISCTSLSLEDPAIQKQSNNINEDFTYRMQVYLRNEFGL